MSVAPYTFANLLGQHQAKRLLARAAAHGRLAHAYLFRGPDGVGKKRAAITLGAWLNCLDPSKGLDSCGQCASCRRFASVSHPDLKIIRPDGAAIKIDQVRQLKQELSFAPFESPWRVVVLEDVHTMRREAANSLLKTLEEPPAGNILILTADEAGRLLPTIVSRCQQVAFHGLRPAEVARLLAADGIAEESALTLAALAEGSPGQARRLHDLELLPLRQEVVKNLVRLTPGSPEAVAAVFMLAEKIAGLKEHIADFFELLKVLVRDLVLLAAGGPEQSIINRDLAELLKAAARRWPESRLAAKLAHIRQAERELARNCNRSLVCEVLLLNLL